MTTRYSYPVVVHEERDGGFSITFTDGDTLAEAILEAADCLEEALAGRIARREEIPNPSPAKGRPAIVPGATLAAKAALYEALRAEQMSNSALASAMGIHESEVRRMLDPRHPTKIGRLEQALACFGKRLVITVEQAAWLPGRWPGRTEYTGRPPPAGRAGPMPRHHFAWGSRRRRPVPVAHVVRPCLEIVHDR